MTDAQIKQIVERFLNWKLPSDFAPDGGVSFEPIGSKGTPHEFRREPVGTNLLNYQQAEAMVRHMLADSRADRETTTRSSIAAAMISGETQ